jgi:hypothetical protein
MVELSRVAPLVYSTAYQGLLVSSTAVSPEEKKPSLPCLAKGCCKTPGYAPRFTGVAEASTWQIACRRRPNAFRNAAKKF